MNDDATDEPVPWELIAPLISWMVNHKVTSFRVAVTTAPSPVVEDPDRDESVHLLYCEEAPLSPGLRDIYVTSDEDGYGRINGPTSVPQSVLRPLLRALDDASVSELLVSTSAAEPEASPAPGGTVADTQEIDVEEYEVPAAGSWEPFLAVQVPDGDVDV